MIHQAFPSPKYAAADLVHVFRQKNFEFLPADLIIQSEGYSVQDRDRAAIVSIDDLGCVRLRILPNNFTKDELLDLRDEAEPLDDGFPITVFGREHTMALFYSRMTFEDNDVTCVDLGFELDPFAEQAA